jgi:hypothetical protein
MGMFAKKNLVVIFGFWKNWDATSPLYAIAESEL